MAYEKHNWSTGEVITADKLNHIEDGVTKGSPFTIINSTMTVENIGGDVAIYVTNVDAIFDAIEYIFETKDCSKYLINYACDEYKNLEGYALLFPVIIKTQNTNMLKFRGVDPDGKMVCIISANQSSSGQITFLFDNDLPINRAELDKNGGYNFLEMSGT